jgi:hypothetical protein
MRMTAADSIKASVASEPSAVADSGAADWRVETLGHLRRLILGADPAITEEVKWRKPSNGMRGIPVWSCAGIVCTGETYKDKVKLTFARGASLPDPARLLNASLDGNVRRAIDIRESDAVDADDFLALVRAAVSLNQASAQAQPKGAKAPSPR